jgi:uncharacterized spore protein YtfJ
MTSETGRQSLLDNIADVKEALSVRRVFGDPYEVNGATLIPVAVVRGGSGGGSGEGSANGQRSGTGNGMGFGLSSRPVGVFVVKDGDVEWMPSIDITRLAVGGLVVAGLAVLRLRRRRFGRRR